MIRVMLRKDKGFTLIEVLIATVLLVTSALALAAGMASAARLNSDNQERQRSLNGIVQQLEAIKSLEYASIGMDFTGDPALSTLATSGTPTAQSANDWYRYCQSLVMPIISNDNTDPEQTCLPDKETLAACKSAGRIVDSGMYSAANPITNAKTSETRTDSAAVNLQANASVFQFGTLYYLYIYNPRPFAGSFPPGCPPDGPGGRETRQYKSVTIVSKYSDSQADPGSNVNTCSGVYKQDCTRFGKIVVSTRIYDLPLGGNLSQP